MAMKLVKATPVGRKLRCSIQGPSGAGKTRTALRVATGIVQREGGRVALVDAEEGRALLEAHNHDFDVIQLEPEDRTPEGFIKALHLIEESGATVAILDGASEEWKAILRAKDAQSAKEKYTGWGKLTPRHDAFFDAIRRSPIHVILTYRMRMAHEVVDGEVRKLGLSAIAREETEYEMDLAFEVDLELRCRIAKPPRGIFDVFQNFLTLKAGEDLGHKISDALRGLPPVAAVPAVDELAEAKAEYNTLYTLVGAANARAVLGKAPDPTVEALRAATAKLRKAHEMRVDHQAQARGEGAQNQSQGKAEGGPSPARSDEPPRQAAVSDSPPPSAPQSTPAAPTLSVVPPPQEPARVVSSADLSRLLKVSGWNKVKLADEIKTCFGKDAPASVDKFTAGDRLAFAEHIEIWLRAQKDAGT